MCICIFILFGTIALFSGSKKALLTLILGTITFEVLISKGWDALIKILLIGIMGYALIWYIFNNPMLYSVLGRRIEKTVLTISGTARENDIDGSYRERKFYMKEAMQLFYKYPILGYGGNSFVTLMRDINYKHVAYSHNNFTELLATLGIVGFILYYYYWVKIIYKLSRKIMKNKVTNSKYYLFFTILVILMILDYGNVSYISEFNVIFLCLAENALNILNKDDKAEEKLKN